MIELTKLYQETIDKLSQGHRGLIKLSKPEHEELKELTLKALEQKNANQLHQALCILTHLSSAQLVFEDVLITVILADFTSKKDQIFALEALSKHSFQARFLKGERLGIEVINAIKETLKKGDLETKEWCLRLILEAGNQSVAFRPDIEAIKVSWRHLFNKRAHHIVEMINLLKKRWPNVQA